MKKRKEFHAFILEKARKLNNVGEEFYLESVMLDFPGRGACEYVLFDEHKNIRRGIIEYDPYEYD